nr:hypothetical protein JCGZ_08271 [Ipomoea batatas]
MSVHQKSNPSGSKNAPPPPENPKVSAHSQFKGKGKGNVPVKPSKAPWADLFRKSEETVDPSFNLSFYPPVNGTAVLEESEIWVPPKPWKFGLLGCFAGRFPGLEGLDALVKTWKVGCKANPQPNGFVLFRFQSEEDRCSVISSGPYFLYGKRLFFDSLPENFRLESSDLCMKPTWVRFTDLPSKCWKPAAFSKIASCIGNPICMDKVTKIGKKRDYARILVEIDSSIPPLEYVPVLLPNGETFNQAVFYEDYPCFCMHCKSVRHYKEQCPKLEPLPGSGDRREPRQIDICKRVGLEWKWKNIVLADCSPGLGLGGLEGAITISEKDGLGSSSEEILDGKKKELDGNDPLKIGTEQQLDEKGTGLMEFHEGHELMIQQVPRSIEPLGISELLSKINLPVEQFISPKNGFVVNIGRDMMEPEHSKGLELIPFKPSVVVSRSFHLEAGKGPSWDDFTDMAPVFSSSFPSLGPFAFDKEIMALQIKAKKASKEFAEFQQEANRVCKRFAELKKSPLKGSAVVQMEGKLKEKPVDFKAALLSPPKDVQNHNKNGGKVRNVTKSLPIPLRAKTLFKGNGRRRPTPLSK